MKKPSQTDKGKLSQSWLLRKKRFNRWMKAHRRFRGTPIGLDFALVDQLCQEQKGERLQRASYIHLSGWKVSGAYRLFLQMKSGAVWQLIYKNAVYNPDHIPALKGLPINPGPPEYLVYKDAVGSLASYLPTVYRCAELIPGRHYQYVLQDLGQEYARAKHGSRGAVKKPNLLASVLALPKLHRAMGEWVGHVDPAYLLHYNREFSAALLPYARRNLEVYAREMDDKVVAELVTNWSLMTQLYNRDEFLEQAIDCPIHGDYHNANMYVHKENPNDMKLIDWEWTGLGRSHADLASILKKYDPEIEQVALAQYAEQDGRFTFNEHQRLYEWSQLERGLLDAAYLAVQQMESSRKVAWLQEYIQTSVLRVRRAQEWLV